MLAIGSPVLCAHFEDRYRNPITDRDAAAREQAAVCVQALDDDLLPMAIELIVRATLMEAFIQQDGRRRRAGLPMPMRR